MRTPRGSTVTYLFPRYTISHTTLLPPPLLHAGYATAHLTFLLNRGTVDRWTAWLYFRSCRWVRFGLCVLCWLNTATCHYTFGFCTTRSLLHTATAHDCLLHTAPSPTPLGRFTRSYGRLTTTPAYAVCDYNTVLTRTAQRADVYNELPSPCYTTHHSWVCYTLPDVCYPYHLLPHTHAPHTRLPGVPCRSAPHALLHARPHTGAYRPSPPFILSVVHRLPFIWTQPPHTAFAAYAVLRTAWFARTYARTRAHAHTHLPRDRLRLLTHAFPRVSTPHTYPMHTTCTHMPPAPPRRLARLGCRPSLIFWTDGSVFGGGQFLRSTIRIERVHYVYLVAITPCHTPHPTPHRCYGVLHTLRLPRDVLDFFATALPHAHVPIHGAGPVNALPEHPD